MSGKNGTILMLYLKLLAYSAVLITIIAVIASPTVYGLVCLFTASLLLGVIGVVVPPVAFITGILEFAGTGFAQKLATWLGLTF